MKKKRQAQRDFEVPDAVLGSLLTKISPWPWVLSMDDRGTWQVHTSGDLKRLVSNRMDTHITNYDMRMMCLAPQLALEVLKLRDELRRIKNGS